MSARHGSGTVVTPNEAHEFWQQQVVTENIITSRYRRELPKITRRAAPSAASPLERVARKRHLTFCAELPALLTDNVNSKLAVSPPPRRKSPTGQIRYFETGKPLHIPSPGPRPSVLFTQHFASPYHLKPNGPRPPWQEVVDLINSNSRLHQRDRETRKMLAKQVQERLLSR